MIAAFDVWIREPMNVSFLAIGLGAVTLAVRYFLTGTFSRSSDGDGAESFLDGGEGGCDGD